MRRARGERLLQIVEDDPALPQPVHGLDRPLRQHIVLHDHCAVDVSQYRGNRVSRLIPTIAVARDGPPLWRVRPEVQGEGGPWSATGSFVSEDPAIINDPLTNSATVGNRIGGCFIAGEGWQSLSLTDAIDYLVPQGCITCRMEYDATNFGAQAGLTYFKDLKWVSMGDANACGDFNAFRKPSLEDASVSASRLPHRDGNYLEQRRCRSQRRRSRGSPNQADEHADRLFQHEALSLSDTRFRSTAYRCRWMGGTTGTS
jgi:hypothetical protein